MTNEKNFFNSESVQNDFNSSEQKQDTATLKKIKDDNLKKNMSLVFDITTSVDGLSTKETPLIESNTTSTRFSPLCRQVLLF